jgi:hypothetical protein
VTLDRHAKTFLRISDLSPIVAYLIGIPAIMLGSVLLVASILALLEPRGHRDDPASRH